MVFKFSCQKYSWLLSKSQKSMKSRWQNKNNMRGLHRNLALVIFWTGVQLNNIHSYSVPPRFKNDLPLFFQMNMVIRYFKCYIRVKLKCESYKNLLWFKILLWWRDLGSSWLGVNSLCFIAILPCLADAHERALVIIFFRILLHPSWCFTKRKKMRIFTIPWKKQWI